MKTFLALPALYLMLCLASCQKAEMPVPAAASTFQAAQKIGPPPVSDLTIIAVKSPCADR